MTESPPAPAPAPLTGRRTTIRLFVVVAISALLVDVISKLLVVANIRPTDRPIRLLGGLLYLVETRNSGAAFSVGTGATVALTAISLVVVAVIVRAARRMTSAAWAVSLGLVLGGALGNLADRLFRAPSPGKGHVVDWISLFADDGHVWPVFNLADSCIVVGGALAVLLSLLGVDFFGGRNPYEASDTGGEAAEDARPAEDDDGPRVAPGGSPSLAGWMRRLPGRNPPGA